MEVDTISHPTFWRTAVLAAGGYDETLTSNEDYELNHRVRTVVGPLVFSPEIRSVYRPRSSLGDLARQFYAYGMGKAEVARLHPGSLRTRHLLPPLAVLGLITVPVLLTRPLGRRLVCAVGLSYVVLLVAAVGSDHPAAHGASTRTFALALPTMHLSWGSGVLRGLVNHRRG